MLIFGVYNNDNYCLIQTCLRHPDSRSAKGNREGVFKKMREAMATITSVVQDEHKEETSENGGLAMDLGKFEVSLLQMSFLKTGTPMPCAICEDKKLFYALNDKEAR